MRELQRRKKRPEGRSVQAQVRSSLYGVTGAPQAGFVHRDPVHQLTESFASSFNNTGSGLGDQFTLDTDPFKAIRPAEEKETEREEAAGPEETYEPAASLQMKEYWSGRYQGNGAFIRSFGQVAFSRGGLAAGILQGEGRMMLISSLKRTVGQSPPGNDRQKMLYPSASVHQNLPGQEGTVIYNRYDVKSAVGLVVSSIRSGRRVLDQFQQAAEGRPLAEQNIRTLQTIYPFLSDREDRALLEEYNARSDELRAHHGAPEDIQAMEYGIRKLHAIIAKKQQQRVNFVTKLQELSAHAMETERMFSAAGFVEELLGEIGGFASGDGDDSGEGEKNGGDSPDAGLDIENE